VTPARRLTRPAGLRRPFAWLPIAIILLAGVPLLLKPLGVIGTPKTSEGDSLTDRVFVRDLSDQAARGIELGETLVNRASVHALAPAPSAF
jgi:hypothetical protein